MCLPFEYDLSCEVTCDIFTCGIMLALKKFQVAAFQVLDVWIMDTESVKLIHVVVKIKQANM